MIKVDLHTHSTASPDGGIMPKQYVDMVESKKLNYVAITDHGRIDFALDIQKILGDRIIVGQEIKTSSGDIIGLYLKKPVKENQPLDQAVADIKSQSGLVYVPHPFEKVRSGISEQDLITIAEQIDIIEVINGRAMFDASKKASSLAKQHNLAACASSDAHGQSGWGRTYTILESEPTRKNLVQLIDSSKLVYKNPGPLAYIYPKYNRIRKALS